MAGTTVVLTARTKTELKRKAQEWQRDAREAGMDIHFAYEDDRVNKTEEGYTILLRAHT